MSMKVRNSNAVTSSRTRFSAAPMSELEFSTLQDNPRLLTTLNAGDIVPVYCAEVLPHDTFSVDLDFVTRQATLAVPVMGELVQDFYAFFVPNRIINKGWVNVMGENSSGSWTAPQVSLAPLCNTNSGFISVPIGSVADYYGFPTQGNIPCSILAQCHDLKFRGYLECYNRYFRNENYTPPIPYSKANGFNGFFLPVNSNAPLTPYIPSLQPADGSYEMGGTVVKELYGDGSSIPNGGGINSSQVTRKTSFSALGKPLKACKLHDYFTSVLPSPQKGERVAVPVLGTANLNTTDYAMYKFASGSPLMFSSEDGEQGYSKPIILDDNNIAQFGDFPDYQAQYAGAPIVQTNLVAELSGAGITISVDDLRMSSAIQRVYELMARGGSRYVELINSFFGLDTDNPFSDIPTLLGHFRRDLDLFQTAQTSATPDGDGTPQGNLAAFGYTNKDGKLFTKTFLEHGYIHIFTVIRHRNMYSTMLDRDNFRMSQLDFYSYPLANIGEQPVYTRQINPFLPDGGVFGYQEAWAEYRYEPDRCSGYMRNRGALGTSADDLSVWNYSDEYDPNLFIADSDFMESNTAQVVARSTALSEREAPQFKLLINYHITKERPLPCYSVPGADIF